MLGWPRIYACQVSLQGVYQTRTTQTVLLGKPVEEPRVTVAMEGKLPTVFHQGSCDDNNHVKIMASPQDQNVRVSSSVLSRPRGRFELDGLEWSPVCSNGACPGEELCNVSKAYAVPISKVITLNITYDNEAESLAWYFCIRLDISYPQTSTTTQLLMLKVI